ncbi:MAG: PEP-CTERM sorting domain-containing protein [Akkermansia sp.]|nr:PEP-CTERM sorting domain-containing protein [Akkermansia sp.]
MNHTQILNFHLVDGLATAEAPVLALSGTDQYWHKFNMAEFSLGIIADDVTDWGVLAGRTVTLVESQLAITGFGSTPYKVVDVTKTGQSASKGILTMGNEGKELRLKVLRPGTEVLAPGDSRQAGSATITALKENEPGLLDNLTLDTDTILGAGRAASLADGLKIQSDADLMIKNMTITANNEIHVGENTITLRDVTIKLSEDYFDRENPVDGVYYFKLQDLFHCDVEFNNVVFDATDLTLPQGFDPSKDAIGLDFGNEVNIDMTDGMYLHMGGDWSQTMSLVDGKPVFTKLVPTPEPATGGLSLLGLGLLAGRRRKH